MANDISPIHNRDGLPRKINAEECMDLVQELLSMGGRLVTTKHAFNRMEERDIVMTQVMNVLRRGKIVSGPVWSEYRNWAFMMQADTAGQMVRVKAAIDTDFTGQVVLVITTF